MGAIHLSDKKIMDHMFRHYENLVGSKVGLQGKTVVDFGCGDGLLGHYLFQKHGISRYVGYDISSVNIESAKKILQGTNSKLIESRLDPWDFKAELPDVFVSLACVIHFPGIEYLDHWLRSVNECGASDLVIEIQNPGKGTQFTEISCPGKWETRIICYTNEQRTERMLDNYLLTEKTDPLKNSKNCQVLWFKLR